MRVVLNLQEDDPEKLALVARYHLLGVIATNRLYLVRNPGTPPVYESGIRFRAEPWAGKVLGIEFFAGIPDIILQGWGDCAMLAGWRIAELQQWAVERGADPRTAHRLYVPKIYWRIMDADLPTERRLFHVQVRHPAKQGEASGAVEDISRYLDF